jgi:predicted DNA-binding transcriptional regulator AlpA
MEDTFQPQYLRKRPRRKLLTRRGPKPLVSRLKDERARSRKQAEALPVEPLWTVREVLTYLVKGRTAFDDFLKKNPDFPRVKIGNEWRFDPASVRAYIMRAQLRGGTNVSTTGEDTNKVEGS